MQTAKRIFSLFLALLMATGTLCLCATAAEKYPEEFYWDKAGDDADNGYKAFMVEYGSALMIPDDPKREGSVFLGWKDWNTDAFVDLAQETMNAKGRRFYAAWKLKTVPSYFYVFGTLLCTVENIPGEAFIHPRCPEAEGYTFSGWSPKIPDTAPYESMTFYAVFTANTYIATLIVDGKVYKEIEYTYGQKSIDLPEVPKKDGYTGAWESYTLPIGGVTINAIYTPNTYIATLMVDGEVFKEIEYTYGQKSIQLPDVPEKDGYTGAWESYTLPIGGVTINAIYTPNTYIATLIVDGKVFKEIEYTYGQKSIDLPDVPKKEGYTGTWAPYTLPVGGVKIRAIYTPVDRTVKTIAGDADGDSEITLRDVVVIQRSLAGGFDTDETCPANMDVNADGVTNLKDVVLVRRYLAGGWNVELR
ncbi:MAG: InlB B-repeat-containing protein [Clostridiales bacterium]|nr:InlB B-repeat-containing protein [Clostridiales bacterium]